MNIDIPANHPVQPLRTAAERAAAKDPVSCGGCGLSWDDAIPTSYTPAPSARCPFEAFHPDEPEEDSEPCPEHRMPLERCGCQFPDVAPDLRTAAAAFLGAFGGNVPDWLQPEAEALEAALNAKREG